MSNKKTPKIEASAKTESVEKPNEAWSQSKQNWYNYRQIKYLWNAVRALQDKADRLIEENVVLNNLITQRD